MRGTRVAVLSLPLTVTVLDQGGDGRLSVVAQHTWQGAPDTSMLQPSISWSSPSTVLFARRATGKVESLNPFSGACDVAVDTTKHPAGRSRCGMIPVCVAVHSDTLLAVI